MNRASVTRCISKCGLAQSDKQLMYVVRFSICCDSFHDVQMALELTESQQQDMMYLRRLLVSKLGQVYRDRKVVLSSMPNDNDGICCSSDRLGDMTDTAEQLRNSGAEELNTYMQFTSAFYRGVSALVIVMQFQCLCLPLATHTE